MSGGIRSPRASGTSIDGENVPAGTNVLVAGPALTGKRRIAFEITGASSARTATLVTTKAPAARMREWFAAAVGSLDDWEVTLIDCVTRSTSFGDGREEPGVRYVSSPGDLTGIGIGLSGVLADWHRTGVVDPRVCCVSLSTLSMYADLRQVYRFLYVVTGRVRTVGGVGAYTIDTNSGSSEAIETYKGLFDAMVEVRDGDDGPELRVRGGSFGPRSWTAF